MQTLPTSNGIPYLPDGLRPEDEPRKARPLWVRALCFLSIFAVLQWAYGAAADTWVQRLFVETLGSRPAAALIRAVTPDISAQAIGARLAAPGGGITIRGGCEGTEVLFLQIAAFAVVDLRWRRRLAGMAIGALLVFACNQVRLLSLFYAYRLNREWFDQLHTIVAPTIFVALVALYFHAWIRRDAAGA